MAVIGGRNVGNNDLVIMGSGVVMFIDSFLSWYGSNHLIFNVSWSGWSSGFLAWFPILLVIAVAGLAATRVFAGRSMPAVGNGQFTWGFIAAAASALATLLILLRWLTFNTYHGAAGAKYGLFIGLIVAAVQTVFGYLTLNAAGEKLPWQARPAA